jgi:hypothetical protein
MPSKGTPKRGIRIDDELWNEAQRIAKENGDNLSFIIRDRLREYVEDHGAAQNMLAEAWEQGYNAATSDEEDSYWGPAVTTPNPYAGEEKQNNEQKANHGHV